MGGYPEWLTSTGEDTTFDLELKLQGGNWAYCPEAVVEWQAPEKFFPYLQKLYGWAAGDGEAGIHGENYWRIAKILILASILSFGVCILTCTLISLLPWVHAYL